MLVDPSLLSNIVLIAAAFGGACVVALWMSLVIWAYRDMRRRSGDPFVQILSALLVAVLNFPGVIIHLLLRPARTQEDEYQHTLEEESLLQALEEIPLCPGCGRRVREEWQVCPVCHTKLKKPCHHCLRLIELPWDTCPYCGTAVSEMHSVDLDLDQALRGLHLDETHDQSSAA